jgi:hypothetical protein
MLSPPSGSTSATIAVIFDVPMSRPTMRLLLSFTFPLSRFLMAVRANAWHAMQSATTTFEGDDRS